jgi:uncharacterized protein with HEPN domain
MRSRESGDAAFLDDLRESCATIVARLQHRSFPDLVENSEFQDGIILQLLLIGEASAHLTEKTRRRYHDAPWKEMIGLRNVLTHKYWSTDLLKIWEIAHDDVPELLQLLLS